MASQTVTYSDPRPGDPIHTIIADIAPVLKRAQELGLSDDAYKQQMSAMEDEFQRFKTGLKDLPVSERAWTLGKRCVEHARNNLRVA